ncbi:hypothetical protein CDAR_287441 [Caerostris darwini]|uniref:Uncharacterized protein n=1 Tax=Caerostris darwini TaxID=1538125 RepID=A0AAV4WZU0_9ARAC|nr:hypothetical protein CDAR_287441 [Caerostris darwini]
MNFLWISDYDRHSNTFKKMKCQQTSVNPDSVLRANTLGSLGIPHFLLLEWRNSELANAIEREIPDKSPAPTSVRQASIHLLFIAILHPDAS